MDHTNSITVSKAYKIIIGTTTREVLAFFRRFFKFSEATS